MNVAISDEAVLKLQKILAKRGIILNLEETKGLGMALIEFYKILMNESD